MTSTRPWATKALHRGTNGRPVKSIKIIGTGTAVPDKVLTNKDLEAIVDTSDDWITERTGIKERRIVEGRMATSDLAAAALPVARQLHHVVVALGADQHAVDTHQQGRSSRGCFKIIDRQRRWHASVFDGKASLIRLP